MARFTPLERRSEMPDVLELAMREQGPRRVMTAIFVTLEHQTKPPVDEETEDSSTIKDSVLEMAL